MNFWGGVQVVKCSVHTRGNGLEAPLYDTRTGSVALRAD